MLYLACPIENLTWDCDKNRWQNSSVQISAHKTYQYTHMDIFSRLFWCGEKDYYFILRPAGTGISTLTTECF